MKLIADLHVHSKYSRATSLDMTLENMAAWARIKGLKILGTGDFTHPEWMSYLKKMLKPQGAGFFVLKDKPEATANPYLKKFSFKKDNVYFVLSAEISLIFSKNSRVRKIHLLILVPEIEIAEKINYRLSTVGNLNSDGRPILGLEAKTFLKMMLDISPEVVVIPAHIWTPWFSLFGASSGFDHIEECFEELTPHVFALETGLSSDPPINWRLSALDRFTLVSNSDAHSPGKIGREANVFNTDLSFQSLIQAIKTGDRDKFLWTIEFFPEEGKYHYDGHRQCQVVCSPEESFKHENLCPVCGKKLTIGVLHRLEELADRPPGFQPENRIPYRHLIPLDETLAQALGKKPGARSVQALYFDLIAEFGSELEVLTEVPVEELRRIEPPTLSQAIESMRKGKVRTEAGYDGVYGRIKVLLSS